MNAGKDIFFHFHLFALLLVPDYVICTSEYCRAYGTGAQLRRDVDGAKKWHNQLSCTAGHFYLSFGEQIIAKNTESSNCLSTPQLL